MSQDGIIYKKLTCGCLDLLHAEGKSSMNFIFGVSCVRSGLTVLPYFAVLFFQATVTVRSG